MQTCIVQFLTITIWHVTIVWQSSIMYGKLEPLLAMGVIINQGHESVEENSLLNVKFMH